MVSECLSLNSDCVGCQVTWLAIALAVWRRCRKNDTHLRRFCFTHKLLGLRNLPRACLPSAFPPAPVLRCVLSTVVCSNVGMVSFQAVGEGDSPPLVAHRLPILSVQFLAINCTEDV